MTKEEKLENKMPKRKFTDTVIWIFFITLALFLLSSVFNSMIVELLKIDVSDYEAYYSFIAPFILIFLVIGLVKRNKYMMKKVHFNILHFLLGLIVGMVLIILCVSIPLLNRDLIITDGTYSLPFLGIAFVLVFIQSSTEELYCRLFMYQRLKETHKNPWFIIFITSLFFALLHLANDGITIVSFASVLLFGVFFAMMIYYFDSIWLVCAIHTAWNYLQNIILGLPNSGLVTPKSLYSIVSAKDGFFYDKTFGIEGSSLTVIVLLFACLIIYLLRRNKK